jgi:gas vesicle protein
MLKKLMFGFGLAAIVGLAVGCDSKDTKGAADKVKGGVKEGTDKLKEGAEKAGEKIKEGAEKAKEGLADAGKKLQEEVLKPIMDKMPAVEEKIKGLTGEAGTKAKAAYEEVKKLVEEFKAAPGDKLADLGKKLKDKFAELAKMVGVTL